MAAAEVEDTIRRLSSHKGVEGIVISTYEGVSLKSTLPADVTTKYAGLMSQLILKARGSIRTIDPENDLIFLRARTRKHEIMVAPGEGYVLVVRSLSGCAPAAASLASLTVTQHTPMRPSPHTHNTQIQVIQKV